MADREWRLASAALAVARAKQRQPRPLRVTEAEAEHYAANLVMHLQEGDKNYDADSSLRL